jgi:putative membrane protein
MPVLSSRSPVRGRGSGEGVRIRDHLANVRTFLAWFRAGLVLPAMGFAVAKFQVIESLQSRYLGVLAAAAGWLVIVIAGVSFIRMRRAIEAAELAPSVAWNVGLSLLTAGAGAAILVYLVRS